MKTFVRGLKRAGRILMGSLLWLALGLVPAEAARLKDLAEVEGVRGNQLFGYGVVVGLNGTGDGNSVQLQPRVSRT